MTSQPSVTRTAIWVQPDAEYFQKDQRIVFEIPGDLHRMIVDEAAPEDKRRAAFKRAYEEFAVPACKMAKAYHGFSVLDAKPFGMEPHDVQEDAEDIIDRTVRGVPKSAVTRASIRDTVFWRISLKTIQRRRLFERFREVKGPMEGFEANNKMPDWAAHEKTVYDNKRDA